METSTKEIKITPPEGFEVDKEHSTFECIRFKPIKIKRWRDEEYAEVSGYFITSDCAIEPVKGLYNTPSAYDTYATEKQAKSALAMARISQIMANDKRFGGAITDEEWENNNTKFILLRYRNTIKGDITMHHSCFLAFHTVDQRRLFLKENEDLVKDYLMIE